MALSWRKKLLLAKIEASYGTDPAPTGGADAILAIDGKIEPMLGKDEDRGLDMAWLGAQPSIPTELHVKVSFAVELEPAGTKGTAPGWGVLLRGCGMAQVITPTTSVTYNPVSSSHESVTLHFHHDGIRYVLTGARGNVRLELAAQKIPHLRFEFQGRFTQPSDQPLPTPDYTGFKAPALASKANTPVFTVNAVPLTMRSLTFDLANTLENRFLIGAAAEEVLITDRAPRLEMLVEATALSAFNPYALAMAQTPVALALQHGSADGRQATLNIPALQIQRPDSPAGELGIMMHPLRGVALPQAGNDDFTLVLT